MKWLLILTLTGSANSPGFIKEIAIESEALCNKAGLEWMKKYHASKGFTCIEVKK